MNFRFVLPWMLLPALWLPVMSEPERESGPRPGVKFHGWPLRPPKVWMGLRVNKPEESTAAQIPDLPDGVGFVVSKIDEGGPAETAGLQKLDVIWKFDDQMLVNESQLFVLLRLKSPGDEVTLSAFRAGKPFDATLKLAKAPERPHGSHGDLMDQAIFPGECGLPTSIVDRLQKTASYQRENGKAEVKVAGDAYRLTITDSKEAVIHESDIPKDGKIRDVPREWIRIAYALRRGLDHALESAPEDPRQPRPRVVAPSEKRP
ncbi:MAG: PDZ domain-containing protein [Verrucomicrobiae bacterium]|nr:PDZ domain-containing protein [Verrucomicrobiae bacterium]MCP5533867.1 PDZ domain-containing protein [Akkermansiaceae bacterium]MCP5547675.1 PDZ domain-containing protein [Akkermansiaceae bacterium]